MENNILVKWQHSDGGWREGVLMCLGGDTMCMVQQMIMRDQVANKPPAAPAIRAIIYDRHRSERCIVPLSAVSLVEPRCSACDGTGEIVDEIKDSRGNVVAKVTCECSECHRATQ